MRVRPGAVLFTVAVGQFMTVASSSVVGVALPTIARDLGAHGEAQQWIVDAYILVFASLLVAGGVLGDRHGRRDAFLVGIALFATGSAICALAPTTAVLLAGRIVQGLGPALVLPASLAIVTVLHADPGARARAIGLWSTASGLGLALGPAIGGVLVDAGSWRWVFGVNVPVCALVAVLALRFVPRARPEAAAAPFDALGAAFTILGVGALCFGIIEGRSRGWTSASIVASGVLAAAALTAFVVHERRLAHPLVDVSLFRRRAFSAANFSGAAVFFALIGAAIWFSAFFQEVQARSPLAAGLAILPLGVGTALAAPVSGRLTARLGARTPMLLGLVVGCVATLGLLRLDAGTSLAAVWWNFAIVGAGVGLALPPMTATAVGSVEHTRAGMASAIHNATRQVGQSLGVAVLGSLVLGGVGAHEARGGVLDPVGAAGYVDGLHRAIVCCAAVLASAAVVTALGVPRRPRPTAPNVRNTPL